MEKEDDRDQEIETEIDRTWRNHPIGFEALG